MEPPAKVLEVSDLSVALNGSVQRPLLTGVSFDLLAHQVIGIIGESGSGKTSCRAPSSTGSTIPSESPGARSSFREEISSNWQPRRCGS
jgi:ABC-type glutathione transport system ATPase component